MEHFPYFARRKGFSIDSIDVHMILDPSVAGASADTDVGFHDDVGQSVREWPGCGGS